MVIENNMITVLRAILCTALVMVILTPVFGLGSANQNLTEPEYTTHATISITANSGFTAGNGVTGGTGIQGDPYLIVNYEINAAANHGIYISGTNVYFRIYNCYVRDGVGTYYGIFFNNVQHGFIENCKASNNQYGIYFEASGNCSIINSNITSNTGGGILTASYSNYNNISSNDVYSNGPFQSGISSGGHYNKIKNNILGTNDFGITCNGNSNVVSDNTITSNTATGITNSGSKNIVANNSLTLNSIGINLGNSNNIIYHNNFVDNTDSAYDNGNANTWNLAYPSGGNYWGSDYTGSDNYYGSGQDQVGVDGIGDSAFNIGGSASAKDNYPLKEPWGTDTIPPISYVNSISPYLKESTPLTLTATAIDLVGVSSVEFWYRYSSDNVTWGSWTLITTDTAEPWSESFNFIGSYGYYEFYSRARDIQNNYEGVVTRDAGCKYAVYQIPSAPQNLQAVAGNGLVSLSWNIPLSDGGSTITNYKIYRRTNSSTLTILNTIGNILLYVDNAVINEVTYYYKVSAVNSIGEGNQSNEDDATPTAGTIPPSAPQNPQVTAGSSYLSLSWISPTSNGGSAIANYNIYRGITAGSIIFLIKIGNILSYQDNSVTAGVKYFYQISANNSAGEGTKSNTVDGTLPNVPGAPQNFNVTAGNAIVSLSWSAPTSNGGSTITNYSIYRGESAGSTSLLTTVGNVLTYEDDVVTNGHKYYYQVSAVNSVGEGVKSTAKDATPVDILSTPSAPRNLHATAGDGQIHLSWDAPSSNGGSSITEYIIYRRTETGTLTLLETSGDELSFTDSTVTNNNTYFYRIRAVNNKGEGAMSDEANATPSTNAGTAVDNLIYLLLLLILTFSVIVVSVIALVIRNKKIVKVILEESINFEMPSFIDVGASAEIVVRLCNGSNRVLKNVALDLSDLGNIFDIQGSMLIPALKPGMQLRETIQVKPKTSEGIFPVKMKIRSGSAIVEREYTIKVGGTEIY
jgi:parallel beta-helix repeat protein